MAACACEKRTQALATLDYQPSKRNHNRIVAAVDVESTTHLQRLPRLELREERPELALAILVPDEVVLVLPQWSLEHGNDRLLDTRRKCVRLRPPVKNFIGRRDA
jgi:hypothetical protein